MVGVHPSPHSPGAAFQSLRCSFGHFGMHRQPPVNLPVRLPKGSIQLFQLRAQGQLHGKVHAQGFQPLLQPAEGGSGGKEEKNVSPAALLIMGLDPRQGQPEGGLFMGAGGQCK